jgi:anti-sigma regulatory factor (Ser/Thr protein kinase)
MLADRVDAASVIADAELIVSELLSNAINASCTRTELMLSAREDCVRIEVHDDASGLPQPRHPDSADLHGRGLLIVSALATDWGVETSARGKRVWAELALI